MIEIKHLVETGLNPDVLIKVMKEKQDDWESQIEIAKFNLENIEKIISTATKRNEQAGWDEDDKINA